MDFHPAANLFPLMTGDEFATLVSDIAEYGQREPIVLHDGMILDGRNRYRACMELGLKPEYREWHSDESPTAYVISLNLHRRHLTSSQRAVVALDALPMLEAEAKERQKAMAGTRYDLDQKIDQGRAPQATAQAAQLVGTNRQYVSDAKKIAEQAPELLESIRNGEMTITQAKRQNKESHREQRRQENATKANTVPDPLTVNAHFATILIDPPWDWSDENDVNQMGRAKPDYATLTIDQLAALPVGALADTDCHLYLWITNRSLPKGFTLLASWGFRYVTCLTWVKPSFGMGNYFRGQTEHILFGVKGSQPLLRHDIGTVFHAERGPNGHSSKPPMIYDLIESCSPGPYLEMFARTTRPNWRAWGADAQ